MKEYFISEIDIEKLYHLSDIKIKLDSNKTPAFTFDWEEWFRKNIIVVGDRKKFLRAINDEKLSQVFDQYPTWINEAKKKYYLHLVIAKNMRQIRILNNV